MFRFPSRMAAAAAVLALPVALTACDSTDEADDRTLVEVAQADSQLTVLVQAVVRANLAATLSDESRTFTVFAPTDAAFTALTTALGVTRDQLLARSDLASILSFHVTSGEAPASALSNGTRVTTLLGGRQVTVIRTGNSVGIDTDNNGSVDARVVQADVEASNGILHKIDAVLVP